MKKQLTSLIICGIVSMLLVGCQNSLDKNLVGYWDFNEGQGEEVVEQVSQISQHINYVYNKQNQNMLYKEASDPLWKSEGVKGASLLFDGYSTFITHEDYKLPTEEITISLWVAPRAYEWGDGGLLSAFISQGNKEKNEGVVFGNYKHGTWSLQLGVGDSNLSGWLEIWDEGHPLPKNEWSYVTATYNAKEATAKLYLNGELVNEETFQDYKGSPVQISDEAFTIGKSNNNLRVAGVFDVNVYSGMMDELKIYNKVLNEEQIRKEYESYVGQEQEGHPQLKYETIQLDSSVYDGDRYRPQYHAMPAGHWMNEPHAPIYYNGKYHLFFQHNPNGPFWHQIHWGHWVSDDMIHWEVVEEAIAPTAGDITPDGVWTGGATYDTNGIPTLFFTAGNDNKKPNQSIGIATPKDTSDEMLKEWEIYPNVVVEQKEGQGDFGEFRDPFVWRDEEAGKWYMLICSGTNNGNGGTALAYSSEDLYTWEYHGNFFETNYKKYPYLGEHWELPLLLPVATPDGSVKKDLFLITPHGKGGNVEVYYWLGEFDHENIRFIPDHEEPKLIDFGGSVFTGPSGFVDPKTGRTILFTIAQGRDRSSWEDYYSGWAHSAGMPISLSLDETTHELRLEPIQEIENAREKTLIDVKNLSLEEVNSKLKGVVGDLLEINLELKNVDATEYGIKVRKHPKDVEYTKITYKQHPKELVLDRTVSSMDKTGLGTRTGKLELTAEGTLKLRIFLDRSLLEIYGNNEMSITSRIYPSAGESMGLELIADGQVEVMNMQVYEMGSVYSEETVAPFYQ